MSSKTYTVRPDITEGAIAELASYPGFLQKLLHHRGLVTKEKVEKFLHPDYELDLHDPFLLKGMNEAVERIFQAIEKGEKILIYSDYDADGIPGGVMLREFFEKIGYPNVDIYIPDRHEEGYGFHVDVLDSFEKEGVNLIVTIDCGITNIETVREAGKRNIDVVITDHHEPGKELPEARAIVNPKQNQCAYPEQILCGSGVAFKLVQAILSKKRFGFKEGHEKWFLDLVGIATLSDMVPLVGENRALAHYGLAVLRKSPRPGLQSLWRRLGVDQRMISEDDIGFSLSPRINAASRMGKPADAWKLLKTNDPIEAEELSLHLDKVNDERKGAVAALVKEIKKNLREREVVGALPKVLVLGNPDWRPALLGLAANSVLESFSGPVFLWGRNGDSTLKGSCRSPGTDLVALMEGASDAFIQYGGHKMAGGFAVSHEQIHTLEERLNEVFSSLPKHDAEPIYLDAELNPEDVTWDTYRHVEQLAPFGVGNPKPLFSIKNASILSAKQFGKDKNHIEVSFQGKNKPVKALAFFANEASFSVVPKEGKQQTIIGTLEKSNFRNFPELRVRIVDIIEG